MVLTARKTKLSFPRRPEEIALEYDLPCIIGKDDISFSRKYDLTPWTENIRWSFSKTTPKYDIFCRCSEKMVFSKKLCIMQYFLVLSGKMVFFPRKDDIFLWTENEGSYFSRNKRKYDIFCIYVSVLQTWYHGLLPKKSKTTFPCKNTPKGDWNSKLAP